MKNPLFSSCTVGRMTLPNRIVMAPLTRRRSAPGNIPTKLNALHYAQRASAGLIIAEAAQISPQGYGYLGSPGIHTAKQVKGWTQVTEAVHNRKGHIFLQLWHVGRHSHPLLQPGMELPVAPSAVPLQGILRTPLGYRPHVTPRALDTDEVPRIVEDYADAAAKAIQAGFDGVEIHGANGYLPDQFLQDGTNKRTDRYGGPIENRARFILEVTEAVCDRIGPDRTGIRLSPSGIKLGMSDSDPVNTFSYLVRQLNAFGLAYLHLLEPVMEPLKPEHMQYLPEVTSYFRKLWQGILITNGGFDQEKAEQAIKDDHADLVAFGKLFISNPDLVERFREGSVLSPWNKATFYGGDHRGYTDYPDRFGKQPEL